MCKNLLITLDGSATSEAALVAAARLAAPGTHAVVLTVAEIPAAVVVGGPPAVVAGVPAPGGTVELPAGKAVETRDQAMTHVREQQMEYLTRTAQRLRDAGVEIETRVEFGDPAEAIVATAQRENVDAIVMATHGRTALAEVIFGSVASEVMRKAEKPVIMVRPSNLA